MTQFFYCNKCKKEFGLNLDGIYHNYKCPECGEISKVSGYVGPIFKGLDTIER